MRRKESRAAGFTSSAVVVRVDDTSCFPSIDATTEKITIFVRRIFTEKRGIIIEY